MILVLTPLKLEHEALVASLGQPSNVRIEVGGHGKVHFALSTQRLIGELSPTLVVCAGTCGALARELRPLDVVAGTATLEHDFRLRFVTRPPPTFAGHGPTLDLLTRLSREKLPYLRMGRIASGDEDIVDRVRAEELHRQTGAMAVAWEGAGGARACQLAGVPFLELRAVSDGADKKAAADFASHARAGMARIGSVLEALIES